MDPIVDEGLLPEQPTDAATPASNARFLGTPDPGVAEANRLEWEAQGGAARGLGPISAAASFGGAVYDSFNSGGNIAVDLSQFMYRKFANGPRDPNWDGTSFVEKHAKEIPFDQHWRFLGTRNESEAAALFSDFQWRTEAQKRLAAKGGFTAFTAGAISGLIDVDAPLMLVTGGLSAGAKVGLNATRVGRMLAGTSMGAITGASLGATSWQLNSVGQADEILMGAVFGAGFGFVGGSLAKGANRVDATQPIRNSLAEEVGTNINLGRPVRDEAAPDAANAPFRPAEDVPEIEADYLPPGAPRQPTARPVEEIEGQLANDPSRFNADQSMGAASRPTSQFSGAGLGTITDPDVLSRLATATQFERKNGALLDGWLNPESSYNKLNAAAMHAGDTLARVANKVGVGNDFARMMNSDNPVWKMMGVQLLEDPSGKVRVNQNAAVLQRGYQERFGKDMAMFDAAVKDFRTNDLGLNLWDATMNPAHNGWEQEMFRRVQIELDNRRYGRPSDKSKAIRDLADRHADFYETDVKIANGSANELPVESYAGVKADRTYRQQKWSGRRFTELVEDARKTGGNAGAKQMRENIVDAIHEQYVKLYPTIPPARSRIFAEAVADRALTSRKGLSMDVSSLLRGDEGDAIRTALNRNGMKDPEIDTIIKTLTSGRENRLQPGHTKQRMDVDMGGISSKGIRMVDLFDNDLRDQMARRMSATSGQAAMARMGITSREEFEKWVRAGLEYDTARGKKQKDPTLNKLEQADDYFDEGKPVDKEFVDAVWSMFSGGPVAGGISPTYSRIKKVTSLALMNQLGLTSLAEFAPVAATATWGRFWKHLPAAVRGQFKDKESPLMQEFKHMAFFTPEEVMFNNRFNHESEMAAASGDMGRMADKWLNRGLEIQSHASGMLLVRQLQQRMALTTTTARIFEGIKKADKQFSPARLKDIGFDEGLMKRFQEYVDNGTVQFDADGNLVKLNMNDWDYDDIQAFRNGMTRNTNQLVQKALAGESNVMFHKDGVASMFWQFKSFPLLAMEKQFNRNNRIADQATLMVYINGLLLAGAAYAARQVVNGKDDNLTVEKIARGALGYSNMTGWLPMWVDPLAAAMGLSDYNLGGYGSQGVGSVVSIPASFSVIDRLTQLPGAAARVAGRQIGLTEYSNDDIRALSVLPILGQAFGMSYLLNAGLDQGKIPEKVEERKQAGLLKAAQTRATKAQERQKEAEDNALESKKTALGLMAEDMGWVNGRAYVEKELSSGTTLEDLEKALK